MKPLNFEGAIIKKTDNYKSEQFNNMDLPVLQGNINGEKISQSIWDLTDQDLQNIIDTRKVILTVWGYEYPPVGLQTAPESDFTKLNITP